VALLGKTLSHQQRDLVLKNWSDRTIIILLDSNDPQAAEASRRIYEQLARDVSGQLLSVRLPDGRDPGQYQRSELWNYLHQEAEASGVWLSV
jgi:hypothetical protein